MKIFSLLLLTLTFNCVQGQFNWTPDDARTIKLKPLKNDYFSEKKISFSQIVVRDFRFDTTKLGYYRSDGYCRIILDNKSSGSFTKTLNEYFKNALDNTSPNILVLIIRGLWLQNNASEHFDDGVVRSGFHDERFDDIGICQANIDAFILQGENYFAATRLDHFFFEKYTYNKLNQLMVMPFDSVVRKIAGMNIDEITKNKKNYSWEQIEKNYNAQFDLPILKTTNLKRGVYNSFAEFKLNSPGRHEFVVKKGKFTDEIYESADGPIISSCWGYCDGQDIYIKSGYNFFKLFKENNGFIFYGSKYIRMFRSTASGPSPIGEIDISWKSKSIKSRPLALNMITGEVY